MKIAVIGTGYVGLVSAVCFAKLGHEVVGVDKDSFKISELQKNIIPILITTPCYSPYIEFLDKEILEKV